MLLGAASIACTIILVEDFDNPFEGFVTVSPAPMQEALAKLSAPRASSF
jgi:hypothetical protein